VAEHDVVKVAGSDKNAGATVVFVMSSSDGTRNGALKLLGTAAIVPGAGALRALAGEFAFTAHVPRGSTIVEQIVLLDDKGNQIIPRTVTVDPL
jgi:hypothetical protein